MKQANLHSKAIHELHTQIMLEAEENMLKSETISPNVVGSSGEPIVAVDLESSRQKINSA